VLAGCFVEDLDVFEIGVRAETSVGRQCPRSGSPVATLTYNHCKPGFLYTKIEKQNASKTTYHASKHVFGSLTSGNVTTTAGS
jgi:hypothetical protein